MANLPTDGGSEGLWGALINAFLLVVHNADGTLKKAQALIDLGWSPTSYTGGESVTFPNGLIMKMGSKTFTGGSGSVSFGTAFPTACKSITLTLIDVAGGGAHIVNLTTTIGNNAAGFSYTSASGSSISSLSWIAMGR